MVASTPPFNGVGYESIRTLTGSQCASTVAVQPDGKIVLGGSSLQVKDGLQAKFETAFAKAIKGTRKEKGSLRYDLNRDAKAPTRYLVYERWKSLKDLEARHANAVHHQPARRAEGHPQRPPRGQGAGPSWGMICSSDFHVEGDLPMHTPSFRAPFWLAVGLAVLLAVPTGAADAKKERDIFDYQAQKEAKDVRKIVFVADTAPHGGRGNHEFLAGANYLARTINANYQNAYAVVHTRNKWPKDLKHADVVIVLLNHGGSKSAGPPTRPGGAVLILDTPKSNKMYANYIDRFVMGTAFDEGVLILDTPKSDKMYANYIDRFLMTAAFDEGVGEAELVQ